MDIKKLFAVLVVGGSALGVGVACGQGQELGQKNGAQTAPDGGVKTDGGSPSDPGGGGPKNW